MYNKVILPNPRYNRLRMASVLLILFAAILAVMMILCARIKSLNLNGKVDEVTGEVTSVKRTDGYLLIELDGKTTYTATPIEDSLPNPNELKGKTVTLVLPQRQMSSEYRWIIGITEGNTVIVDYEKTLYDKLEDNKTSLIALGVPMGVLVLASGLVYVWQKRTPSTVEKDLGEAYCQFTRMRMPSCLAYRLGKPYVTLVGALLVAAYGFGAVATDLYVSDAAARIALFVCMLTLFVATAVVWGLLVWLWMPKKEREFYAENFPFDFFDLSQVLMRKKTKQQLQAELRAEREAFPHRYEDGGNMLVADFTEKGVSLSEEDGEQDSAPSAQDVFGEGGDAPVTNRHLCDLSYDELNFEAVPHFYKGEKPFSVVIKSRLNKTDDRVHGVEMANDLYFLLDSNLLATLRLFGVKVENLDDILARKAELIEQHCRYFTKPTKNK